MARITSRKIGSKHRSAQHLDGGLADPFGIVFSGDVLILNMSDGERVWNVSLEPAETFDLAHRFQERLKAEAE